MDGPDISYPVQRVKSKSAKSAWPLLLGVIIIAIIVGGVLMSRQPKKQEEKKEVVATITEAPSPTDKPKIEKSSVKIQVQNGTGTPGQAGTVVKALEDAGYSTDNIKSSNAEKYDQVTTTITSRSDYEEIVSNIKDVLKPTFAEISEGSSNLKDESEFDIVIVTGGKLFATETPTSSPTATLTSSPSPTP